MPRAATGAGSACSACCSAWGLAAVVIVGAVSTYNAARESANRSAALTLLSQLRANIEAAYAGAPSYGNKADLVPAIDRRGGIPGGARVVSGKKATISHPFGGAVTVIGGPGGITKSFPHHLRGRRRRHLRGAWRRLRRATPPTTSGSPSDDGEADRARGHEAAPDEAPPPDEGSCVPVAGPPWARRRRAARRAAAGRAGRRRARSPLRGAGCRARPRARPGPPGACSRPGCSRPTGRRRRMRAPSRLHSRPMRVSC